MPPFDPPPIVWYTKQQAESIMKDKTEEVPDIIIDPVTKLIIKINRSSDDVHGLKLTTNI